MTKLDKLLEIKGYDTLEELLEAILSDSVSPAICMNEGCNFTCEALPWADRRPRGPLSEVNPPPGRKERHGPS